MWKTNSEAAWAILTTKEVEVQEKKKEKGGDRSKAGGGERSTRQSFLKMGPSIFLLNNKDYKQYNWTQLITIIDLSLLATKVKN